MRILAALALAAVLPAAPAAAQATDEVSQTITCRSSTTTRQSCPVQGEILSASLTRLLTAEPCFLGYTWGFEENGLWTAGGCSAEFVVATVAPAAQQGATPEQLERRLKRTRERLREARRELAAEREARAALEAELNDVRAGGVQEEDRGLRALSLCGQRALGDLEKVGATRTRLVEILAMKPTDGSISVIGRTAGDLNGERQRDYFRCWVNRNQIVSFETGL